MFLVSAVPIFTGCYLSDVPRMAVFSSVAGLVNETALFVMMLYKAWSLWRENRSSPLLKGILRDRLVVLHLIVLLEEN